MNTDDIIELAREAGLYVGTNLSGVMLVGHAKQDSLLIHLDINDLTRFAALVRAEDEAILRQALEALEEIQWSNDSKWQSDRAKVAIAAIKERLE